MAWGGLTGTPGHSAGHKASFPKAGSAHKAAEGTVPSTMAGWN
jgi:hypothetical protein